LVKMTVLFYFYSLKIPREKMYHSFKQKILSSTTVFKMDNNKKCFSTPNQYIRNFKKL